jgi:hypothetical protein
MGSLTRITLQRFEHGLTVLGRVTVEFGFFSFITIRSISQTPSRERLTSA